MNRMQLQVLEFMQQTNQELADKPTMPSEETIKLRLDLINEEFTELRYAFANHDGLAVIDALCDLLYVTIGTANSCGINLEPFFDEVHRSNMTKICETLTYDPNGKLLKPLTYDPPHFDRIDPTTLKISERTKEVLHILPALIKHIEAYTIPQYGDKGEDQVSNEYTLSDFSNSFKRYANRLGRNSRGEMETFRDCLKIAHYSIMLYNMLKEGKLSLTEDK